MAEKTYTVDAGFTVAPDENCYTALAAVSEKNPEWVLFSRPEGHGWVDVTAAEFVAEVREVAKGLIGMGLEKNDRVALLSGARYEWALTDFAVMAAGGILVPIYPTSSLDQVQWIVEDSGAVLAIAETYDHEVLFEHLVLEADGTPQLAESPSKLGKVLQFNREPGAIAEIKAAGVDVPDELLDERIAGIRHDDIASLVYTSGTTGRSKGCIITHLNWIFQVRAMMKHPIGKISRPGSRMVTYLPMAHVLARSLHLLGALSGTTQTHWDDVSTIAMEYQRVKPNMVIGVPRVYEKVRDSAYRKASDGSAIGAWIFKNAEKTAMDYSQALEDQRTTGKGPSMGLKIKRKIFDKLVYSKILDALGGEVEYAITGASALGAPLGHFFRGIGLPVYEGYGLTETTSAASVNFGEQTRIGSVGRPMLGYSAKVTEDGEICLKSHGIFGGYWNNDEATAEVMDGDWFHTGDLGEIDDDGFIRITGRKKDILVTSGGKNVAPQPLEEQLRLDPLISQAVVVGDGKQFVGVLITLNEEELASWKDKRGIPADTPVSKLAEDPNLRGEVQDAINLANKTVSNAEAIKKFRILPRDLTEEDGELTATLKVKRPVVLQNFDEEMRKLYP